MQIVYLVFFVFLAIYLIFNFYIIYRVWKLRMSKDKTPIVIAIYFFAIAFIILATLFWTSIF